MGRPWDAHTAWNEALDVFDALGHRQADDIRGKIKELGVDG
ncbi:hypothetical protein [Streptomyces sp. NPDC093676]